MNIVKELNINGNIFHFVPFNEWRNENSNIEYVFPFPLNIPNIEQLVKYTPDKPMVHLNRIRHYGLNGEYGLISIEPTSWCGEYYDVKEWLEAGKLGCNILYEY